MTNQVTVITYIKNHTVANHTPWATKYPEGVKFANQCTALPPIRLNHLL
jgi:hypothetical protein